MKVFCYIVISLSLLTVMGCGDTKVDRQLGYADTVMFSHPNSAVALLESLEIDSLDSPRCMYRALLLAKARDKNCTTIYPEETAPFAEYFSDRGDSIEYQAFYYHGYALSISKEYESALLVLTEAYQKALAADDYFYAAMSSRELSDVYLHLYIPKKALYYTERAKALFLRAGLPVYASWEDWSIIRAHLFDDNQVRALELCDSVNQQIFHDNSYFRHTVETLKANCYFDLGNYAEAIKLYKSAIDDGFVMTGKDWCLLGDAYLKEDMIDSAVAACDSAVSAGLKDSIYIDYVNARIYARQGDMDKAYHAAIRWGKNIMDDGDRRITRPQTLALTDYFELKAKSAADEALYSSRIALMLIVICILFIVVAILLWFRYKESVRRRERQIAESVVSIRCLEEDLERYIDSDSKTKAEFTHIFQRQLDIIDNVCKLDFKSTDTKAGVKMLRSGLGEIVNNFRNQETLKVLENMIDRYHDGWINRFRTDFPGMKSDDYALVIYLYLGFSADTIAVLFNVADKTKIYVTKHRLKEKLLKMNPDKYHDYNKALGLKYL
ncbi:MAG: tetratricopeptide repeat protein [Paramuribaculum sp.]|nr:tetratricopeptide repeat protein [Paramuribaculum sp.]